MSAAAMQAKTSLFIADYLSGWTTREFGAGQSVPIEADFTCVGPAVLADHDQRV